MKGRTVQLGGETLSEGSTVIVFTGRRREERNVVRVGTKLIHTSGSGREKSFDIVTRAQTGCVTGFIPYFRTLAEVAAMDRRQELTLRLRQLGLQSTDGALRDLGQYPDEVLEEVVGVLSKYQNSGN